MYVAVTIIQWEFSHIFYFWHSTIKAKINMPLSPLLPKYQCKEFPAC